MLPESHKSVTLTLEHIHITLASLLASLELC